MSSGAAPTGGGNVGHHEREASCQRDTENRAAPAKREGNEGSWWKVHRKRGRLLRQEKPWRHGSSIKAAVRKSTGEASAHESGKQHRAAQVKWEGAARAGPHAAVWGGEREGRRQKSKNRETPGEASEREAKRNERSGKAE